jgi:hypothetical protein
MGNRGKGGKGGKTDFSLLSSGGGIEGLWKVSFPASIHCLISFKILII